MRNVYFGGFLFFCGLLIALILAGCSEPTHVCPPEEAPVEKTSWQPSPFPSATEVARVTARERFGWPDATSVICFINEADSLRVTYSSGEKLRFYPCFVISERTSSMKILYCSNKKCN
jgi:hypothetical protein